ncbi:LuxR family transcriptional regulator [Actinospica durhamensis]|uniref:LuxR family transcriptional regulator n=1 Tax=Actinospica durhamensis TaxID=1508375 RepID=A0A941IWB3_9ACTN|nr:LuxR C-terminal-related transcriptional regulator [Actinospica durhamensis]MBR7838931.1 LuxR family transcriptional regulator [Actinospica durhamensis]
MLELLGLDVVGQAVYQEILAEPEFGVVELCESLGLTEHQVRAALDQLADLALVRTSRDRPGTLHAVDPQAGFEAILRRQEEDLARRQQELAVGKAAAAHALAQFAHLRPNTSRDGATRLIGLDAVQARIEQLARDVRSELCSVTPGAALPAQTLELGRPVDALMLERGITLQVLYQDAVRNSTATFAYAQWMTEQGAQVRTAPLLPPRLLIFDREYALVPIDPSDPAAGALCTREPGMLASLIALFEQAWNTAIPLGADKTPDGATGLTSTERTLLTLLAGGMTDEAAAKRLGVSLRTVRRQMAGLMERLNASSRFEAGLKAAQRGWL